MDEFIKALKLDLVFEFFIDLVKKISGDDGQGQVLEDSPDGTIIYPSPKLEPVVPAVPPTPKPKSVVTSREKCYNILCSKSLPSKHMEKFTASYGSDVVELVEQVFR